MLLFKIIQHSLTFLLQVVCLETLNFIVELGDIIVSWSDIGWLSDGYRMNWRVQSIV